MTYLDALLLGIVEGITEFLPISSTAHLMLLARLLKLEESPFQKTFLIVIQPGAILSVVFLYWRTLLVEWHVLLRVLLAFIPTGVIAFLLYGKIKELLGADAVALWSLGIGGVVIILFELLHREKPNAVGEVAQVPYWKCVLIGFCQALSLVPGVSRAAATILGGLALGLKRKTAVEFSFLLAIPTMGAASVYDLWKNREQLSFDQVPLIAVGFAVSFVVALLAVQFLLRYIRTHNFVWFGVYRIAVAALGAWVFFGGEG
jgi:undecaprenyl-diphosphatase